jgi:hypothetical protein
MGHCIQIVKPIYPYFNNKFVTKKHPPSLSLKGVLGVFWLVFGDVIDG